MAPYPRMGREVIPGFIPATLLFVGCLSIAVAAAGWQFSTESPGVQVENLQLTGERVLIGEGATTREGVTVTALENGRALIRFETNPFDASEFRWLTHRTSGTAKLLDLRFFWRTSDAPREFHSTPLYPGGHTSFALLEEAEGWHGRVVETGIIISSPAGTDMGLVQPLRIENAFLKPSSIGTAVHAMLEGWLRFWDIDNGTINSAEPPVAPPANPVPLVLVASLLSLVPFALFRRHRFVHAAFTIVLCAWFTVALPRSASLTLHWLEVNEIPRVPPYDRSLVTLVEQVRNAIPECSRRVKVMIHSDIDYRSRRASYLLRPCNAAPGQYLHRTMPADSFLLVIEPSEAIYSGSSGMLGGIGHPTRVEVVFESPRGTLYRIIEGR